MDKQGIFKVSVRSGDKEIKVEIPMSSRASIGLDASGTGTAAINIVEEMVNKIKKLD